MDAWQFIVFVFWRPEKFAWLGNAVLNASLVKIIIFKLWEVFNLRKLVDNEK